MSGYKKMVLHTVQFNCNLLSYMFIQIHGVKKQ